ncbi:unnamed protein product, partial [Gulo gulo]
WTLVNLVVVGEEYSLFLIKPQASKGTISQGPRDVITSSSSSYSLDPILCLLSFQCRSFSFCSLPSAAVDFHQCLEGNDICCSLSHRVGLLLCCERGGSQ